MSITTDFPALQLLLPGTHHIHPGQKGHLWTQQLSWFSWTENWPLPFQSAPWKSFLFSNKWNHLHGGFHNTDCNHRILNSDVCLAHKSSMSLSKPHHALQKTDCGPGSIPHVGLSLSLVVTGQYPAWLWIEKKKTANQNIDNLECSLSIAWGAINLTNRSQAMYQSVNEHGNTVQ